MRFIFFSVFTLLMVPVAAFAQQRDQDPKLRGRAIAKEFCSSCHAIGKIGTSPHVGAPPLRALGDSFNLDEFPARLQQGILTSGHPDMPTFKLKPRDARALRAYLRSIQE
jgi:mono/diheme cytochrome c family protein